MLGSVFVPPNLLFLTCPLGPHSIRRIDNYSNPKWVVKNPKVDKTKREGGAKHSDININVFLLHLMPECFAPTDLFVKRIFDMTRIGLLYSEIYC